MALEARTNWDGVDRRKVDAPVGITALNIVHRSVNNEDTTVDGVFQRNDDPSQNAVREGDFENSDLKTRVADILEVVNRSEEQTTNPEAVDGAQELASEQMWLGEFKTRFDTLSNLHTGIEWTDIEKSLKADPESMRKLQALDGKGHAMNVFGEENGEFIFASAWDNYSKVSADHRNIAYDLEGQRLAERQGYTPTGNAVSIIANIMGVKEEEAEKYLADPKFHEQLLEAISVNGLAWLKTDEATRVAGDAFYGNAGGCYCDYANGHVDRGSFRAALRVKKV